MENKKEKYTFKDVINLTQISPRNIKFWSSIYGIKPLKIGRSNYYSDLQIQLLRLIKFLTDTNFFSQKFIKKIVNYYMDTTGYAKELFIKFMLENQNFFNENSLLKPINFNLFNLDFKKNFELSSINQDERINVAANSSSVIYAKNDNNNLNQNNNEILKQNKTSTELL